MTNNTIDFTSHFKAVNEPGTVITKLEEYDLGPHSVELEPGFKLDLLRRIAINKFCTGQLEASKIHRLLELMSTIYRGFVPHAELCSGIRVSERRGR